MESRVQRGIVKVEQPHLHAVLPEVWNAGDHMDTGVSGTLIPTVSPSLALALVAKGDFEPPAWLHLRLPPPVGDDCRSETDLPGSVSKQDAPCVFSLNNISGTAARGKGVFFNT